MNNFNLDTIQGSALPGFGFTTIGDIITKAVPLLLFFAGIGLLLYIILGGFALMTSRGDPKAIAAGKEKITHGLIGFTLVFTSFWIVQLIGILLGLTDITAIF